MTKRSSSTTVASDVALRGLAIVMVVVNHASVTASARPIHLGGGLNVLLLVSGYSFARFVLSRGDAPAIRRGIAGLAWNVWWPTTLVILLSFLLKREWSWAELLFVSNLFTHEHVSLLYVWFPQVLLQLLAILWLLAWVPGTDRALSRRPLAVSAILLAVCFALLLALGNDRGEDFADRSLEFVAWNFVLGWVARYAIAGGAGPAARLVLLGVTVALATVAFGWGADWLRAAALPAGLALLLFAPGLSLPRGAARAMAILSQAAFTVFLLHVFFLRLFDALHLRRSPGGFDLLDTLAAAGFALAGSVAAWIALAAFSRAWRSTFAQARAPRNPGLRAAQASSKECARAGA